MSTMEIDPNETDSKIIKKKSEALQSLATGSLSTSIARLAGSSRGIPSDKDFHYYYLFDEFRSLIDEIAATSKAMLEKIGSAQQFSGSGSGNVFPGEDIDDNAAYNGLVSVNDEILERLDVSVEEFLQIRKEQEVASANKGAVDEDGFQLVYGKKKKTTMTNHGADAEMNERRELTSVRVVEKDKKVATAKTKVPFHIATINRPQDEHNILVNNANQPFEHVWLQKSEDGLKFIHPLEKLSIKEFAVHNTLEPQTPAALENTPFKMVETVKDLKDMAAKLRNMDEIAVDLEHNQYRSFQGLTCLMQISTRTEDFVVDTLKLRIHIGPYLREIFKDPSKKKVMHGADRDIIWLQRDFGIYVCNLFDTGQASRVLQMERNSLEYLLHHFCEVTANKEYQNADWRYRPLPPEMIRYAREDTHYLLYIYDLMRARLLSESTEGNSEDLLLEVYQRSYDICMQLYEKELLTETSYLHLYGLQAANFNAQQLSIVSGLYEWRDTVARAEDESTGYILPNKALLEIAKQMPVTTGKLKRLSRYKHPYIERNLASVVNIVRHSIQHAAAFEAVAKQLAETRPEVVKPVSEAPAPLSLVGEGSLAVPDSSMVERVIDNSGPGKAGVGDTCEKLPSCVELEKATGATVQILKRPSRGFGALLGSSSKKKVDPSSKKEELIKLEQIKSSVNLPFHSFVGDDQSPKKTTMPPSETMDTCPSEENDDNPKEIKTETEDIIPLEGISNDDEDETQENSETIKGEHEEGELMSLSTLASSLNRCIESSSEKQPLGNTEEPSGLQIKPFDYETATKTTKFGGGGGGGRGGAVKKKSTRGGGVGSSTGGGEAAKQDQGDLPQGRRRQAFPASGNRSATFL